MDIRFGDFRLRERERELIGPAGPIDLPGRAFELLRAFLAHPDSLLDKDQLFAAAWPDVIVEDNTLQVHISTLRKALGPDLIATVHGRGYRYVGPSPQTDARASVAPPPTAMAGRHGNIDQYRSDCVARETELAALEALLVSHRLVTVVGAGGVGKTTLAVAAASDVTRPAGGTWMVDLAAVQDGAAIENTLIQTLGVQFRVGSEAIDSIADHISHSGETLLLVDNCEHVLADVARVIGELMQRVPELRVLATSQAPLGLSEERLFRLSSFGLSADGDVTSPSERFLAYCIERFGDTLTEEERPVAARLSARLDGVALALKMAAARASSIGLEVVDRQLEAQLANLTADWTTPLPRHRSLSASLAWSYDLLSEGDQRILRALGAFHGSFSLAAVAAIAGPGAEERVPELARRSLVVRDGSNRSRYRLLDSTRRFALDLLGQSGELSSVLEKHLDFMTELFTESIEVWEDLPDEVWRATYRPDGDNLRAALGYARTLADSRRYVELAAGTSRFFIQEQLGAEGLAVIEAAMELAAHVSPQARARIGLALGEICRVNAMDIRAGEGLFPAIDWLRTSDDTVRYHQALALALMSSIFFHPREVLERIISELKAQLPAMRTSKSKAWSLVILGAYLWTNGEVEAGIARMRSGLAMHRETGNMHGLFRSAMNFSEIAHRGGDTALALATTGGVIPDLRRHGSRFQLANHLSNVAVYSYWIGDIERAAAAHAESILLIPHDDSYWYISTLQNEAEQLHWEGEHARSTLLLGLVDRQIAAWPDGRQSSEQMQRDRLEEYLRGALGDGEFDRLIKQGASLDLTDSEHLISADRKPNVRS